MEKTWSTQQTAIFDFFAHGRGNLVVRARAGTGKTTTIIEALNFAKHEPKILLAAFNKRIAVELTNRVTAPNAEAKTLHGLGFAYIRRQWSNVKVDANVDTDRARVAAGGAGAPDEMVALVKRLAGLLKNIAPFASAAETVEDIALSFDCEPGEEWLEDGWDLFRVCKAAIAARDAATVRDTNGRISFDDMIFIPLANGFARPWFTMVVVDEAQDMNYAQLLLAQKACKRGGRIVVVGDDRQAIYGFRGADADGIDRLKAELKATELGLTVTYRCAQSIVRIAAQLVPDFTAAPSAPAGTVDEVTPDNLKTAAKPGDFVLSRKNAPLISICLDFLRRGVPARVEGRDVAAGLRNIVKGFKARSVPEFIARVQGWATKHQGRAEKIADETSRTAKLDQIADQAATLTAIAEGAVSIDEVMSRLDNIFGDAEEARRPMVVCSSVHKAKGLETDRAFVLDFKARDHEGENIYYVAVTRAKAHLTFVREEK